MANRKANAFTLVEILIVVVILGILAAIVVPQFTNASNEAVKGALQSQLQTITSQVELYRVREQGDLPDADADNPIGVAADNDGWGVLIEDDYLQEVPVNGYTGEGELTVDGITAAEGGDRDSAAGWAWDDAGDGGTERIWAYGFDPVNNMLAHEDDYAADWGDTFRVTP